MLKEWILLVIALSILPGCTSVQYTPLSNDSSNQLQGKKLTTTKYPIPDFAAVTAGKTLFGVIGGVAMISTGNSIIKQNGVEDPAYQIGQRLAEKLAAERNMSLNSEGSAFAKNDSVDALVSTYPNSNYLLDVKTLNWMFGYYPTNWARYRIIYAARLRLIDASSNQVIAESICKSRPVDDNNPPSEDELLDNHAAGLKAYLKKTEDACVDVLARDVLNLKSTNIFN
jgi:hypothetical protein